MGGWTSERDEQQPAGFEFEPERFFDSFIGTVKFLVLRPREFFRQLPAAAPLKNPLTFLLFCSFLTALFVANYRDGDFQLFVLLWCANVTSTVIGSAVMHGLVKRLFRSAAPFGATLRVVAYAGLMDMATWIPVLGPVAYFYGLYLVFVGIQEQHRLSPRQAALTVMAIVCIVTALAIAVMLASPESVTQSLKMLEPQQADQNF